jgi:hypothetical protein
MTLYRVDKKARLYVTTEGHGYSTRGWDNAHARATGVAAWLQRPDLAPTAPLGTEAHHAQCALAIDEGAQFSSNTGFRCPAGLTPQLTGLEGKRVEVIDADGGKRRFYVGKSTGWMPCHLEISRCTSHGGTAAYGPFTSVRVVPTPR